MIPRDKLLYQYVWDILAHQICTSEILPWDRKSYLTHAILPKLSRYSDVNILCSISAYSGTKGSFFII